MTTARPSAPLHGSADTGERFGPPEWAMSAVVALVWGSSFLWIAIAIDDVAATFVPLARIGFGAIALALVPAARRRLPRHELPRIVFLGLVWMAIPFLLFPLAEETTSSAVAGMINGSLPVVTVAVTALFVRRPPTRQRIVAVLVGFVGIAMVSLGSIGTGGGADARGVTMLITAVVCYAVAVNVAAPLQRRYGSLPVLLHVQIAGILWTLPTGLRGASESTFTWQAIASLALLGALGTGLAFALYGVLLERTGPVRGMIGTFFTPVVAAVLGVAFRDEPLRAIAIAGMVVVGVGAVMTSRPEP
ncbi:MAG: DMT family transporter [Ilumatobacteraceae bacterium]|nr:DMT family transporter [Ilumatobacteraceae bacterium]